MVEAGIRLISGGIGGILAGVILQRISLGRTADFLLGLVGGGLAGWALAALGAISGPVRTASGADLAAMAQNMAAGTAGGALLLVLAGALRRALNR